MTTLLVAVALLAPTLLLAQSPFDGTWKTLPDDSKLSQKPLDFSLSNGIYDATTSAGVRMQVKADGQDHPVTGQTWDTFAVKEVDAHTLHLVPRKNGQIVYEETRTASDDGKTLIMKMIRHYPDNDQTTSDEWTLERVGEARSGAHAISGSWQMRKINRSENALLVTFRTNGDELNRSDLTGGSWTAKLDGKNYPVKGSWAVDSVSLKQINDRTIEESYKGGDKLVMVSKRTVSPDGKKMTTVVDQKQSGRVSTFVAEKQ